MSMGKDLFNNKQLPIVMIIIMITIVKEILDNKIMIMTIIVIIMIFMIKIIHFIFRKALWKGTVLKS